MNEQINKPVFSFLIPFQLSKDRDASLVVSKLPSGAWLLTSELGEGCRALLTGLGRLQND